MKYTKIIISLLFIFTLLFMSSCLKEDPKVEKVKSLITKATSLKIKATSFANQGKLDEATKCYNEALKCYNEALKIDPKNANAKKGKKEIQNFLNS